jgi:hypothetical protein
MKHFFMCLLMTSFIAHLGFAAENDDYECEALRESETRVDASDKSVQIQVAKPSDKKPKSSAQ